MVVVSFIRVHLFLYEKFIIRAGGQIFFTFVRIVFFFFFFKITNLDTFVLTEHSDSHKFKIVEKNWSNFYDQESARAFQS